jgi:hypothetical protein
MAAFQSRFLKGVNRGQYSGVERNPEASRAAKKKQTHAMANPATAIHRSIEGNTRHFCLVILRYKNAATLKKTRNPASQEIGKSIIVYAAVIQINQRCLASRLVDEVLPIGNG